MRLRTILSASCLALMLMLQSGGASAKQLELGERDLSIGSWGADVFSLQQHLRSLGYDVKADGRYGQGTWQAVLAFQETHHLKADGVVGAQTALAVINADSGVPVTAYVVKSGDSLWSVAEAFDTTMNQLVSINNLTDTMLQVGQHLEVPQRPSYTVVAGDTLSGIAARFHTDPKTLASLNGINDPKNLQIGQKLRLPAAAK